MNELSKWRKAQQRFTCLTLGSLLFLAVGCGGKPADVSGMVTLDGQPVTRGSVGFTPIGGGTKAVGTIESDGSYELSTNRERGLETGQYEVSVFSRERGEVGENGGPPLPGKYLVPKKYSSSKTSGLQFDVERGSNTINIELSSEGQDAG